MSALAAFIILYLLISVGIGVYAGMRVKNASDYVVAGRSLPLSVTIATVFATWFGSEAVLGIPATFVEEGLGGIVADPFGAGLCLIFVGLFFAPRLYRMKLLTIGDFFRQKYGSTVELLVGLAICISYLGWVSAQIIALGIIINIVSAGAITITLGMILGIGAVMLYTVFGGMWSVVITDFIQMMIIVAGLLVVAWIVATRFDGGAIEVIQHATDNKKFAVLPEVNLATILAFIGTFITLALGSIPQQDVFQRVMSAKNERTAVRGSVLGGSFYILFCFVPIFITYAALLLDPSLADIHMNDGGDAQRILPEFILTTMPLPIQVLFFGALLSAIMSTASGTLLAPSAILAENILKPALKLSDASLLRALRLCVFCFGVAVTLYAYLSHNAGLSIFEMVENAYLVTLCGAFVPLAFGVYWKRANKTGALLSIALGVGSWVTLEILSAGLAQPMLVPPQLAGLCMAIIGMMIGGYVKTTVEIA
jgi:solute:Na+ symporter, SSS family